VSYSRIKNYTSQDIAGYSWQFEEVGNLTEDEAGEDYNADN